MRRNKLRSTTILVGRDIDVGDVVVPRARAWSLRSPPAVIERGRSPRSRRDRGSTPRRAHPARARLAGAPGRIEDEAPDDAADDDAPVAYGARKGARGQSVGKPNHGRLEGGVQLPKDGAYHRRHPQRSFGATHVVELTRRRIAEVRRKHPRVHSSRSATSRIPTAAVSPAIARTSPAAGRHRALLQARTKSYPQRFVGADEAPLHIAATWTLVDAFYHESKIKGGPIAIFLDYDLQRRLADYGRKHGVDKRVCERCSSFPGAADRRRASSATSRAITITCTCATDARRATGRAGNSARTRRRAQSRGDEGLGALTQA